MTGLKKMKVSSGPDTKASGSTAESDSHLEELDHIMNEIEELQQEINTETKAVKKAAAPAPAPASSSAKLKAVPKPVAAPMEDTGDDLVAQTLADGDEGAEQHELRADADSSVSLEETLSQLKDEEPSSGNSVFDQMAQVQESEEPMEEPKNENVEEEFEMEEKESEGCLTMTLTGNMTLKLKYEFGGQEVVVGFTDQFLNVRLADGTEFKVPVNRAKPKRKAA